MSCLISLLVLQGKYHIMGHLHIIRILFSHFKTCISTVMFGNWGVCISPCCYVHSRNTPSQSRGEKVVRGLFYNVGIPIHKNSDSLTKCFPNISHHHCVAINSIWILKGYTHLKQCTHVTLYQIIYANGIRIFIKAYLRYR